MSHLDEGTLNALLDGELADHEVRAIQAHLGGCASCGTRLKSVKEMLTESDRLVGVLEFPGTPKRPAGLEPESEVQVPDLGPPEPGETATPPPRPRPRPESRLDPVYDEAPPVLLVPDNIQWGDRRRRVLTGMRWAAFVLVAAGAGYLANEVRRTGSAPQVTTYFDEPPAAESEQVVSPEETPARTDSAPAIGRTSSDDEPAPESAGPERPTQGAAQPEARAATPAPAPPPVEKAESAPPAEELRVAADDDTADEAEPPVEEPPSPSVREEAARALAELDRQRQMERAAAATAALDTVARRRNDAVQRAAPTTTPAAAPQPAPRTLEQRSQVYLRIGLDEAARQLGRPVHVIEGWSPEFMGLARGSASIGADPTRPVVRVVYQDRQGRMVLLDQQRIRPGQEWESGATRWVQGEIGLVLHGEVGPEVLRNLRPRVR